MRRALRAVWLEYEIAARKLVAYLVEVLTVESNPTRKECLRE